MNRRKFIFAQLFELVYRYDFNLCVNQYKGNFGVKSFTCWEQFLVLSFAQFSYRESLRDFEYCLESVRSKLYHYGIKTAVSRSTLAEANKDRDWRIYADYAQVLYKQRWQVELFFKWIKQNLRVKKFYGNSENAVKIQIWIAVCDYLIIAILKKKLNLEPSMNQILQILSISLFEKIPLKDLLENNDTTIVSNQQLLS